jgi:Tfp pilus assembly protein PilO
MMEKTPWRIWKILIGVALALLLALDIGLAFILWQGSREGEQSLRAQRDRLQTQEKLLEADVQRGRKIRASLPQVGKDCDAFYHENFLSPETAYSSVESDLDAIAHKAGLRTSGISFKRTALKDHGVTEISMTASVEGSYSSVIQFINGLEQSKNFYLLNDLRLDSGTTGAIRLKLELLTYSRT